MNYEARLAVARLLFLIHDKRLRHIFCACRRPAEDFVDDTILKAMDDVERKLVGD
jgi:hypothetical protein